MTSKSPADIEIQPPLYYVDAHFIPGFFGRIPDKVPEGINPAGVDGHILESQDIVSIAEEHELWFHVDGALGGPVILSPRYSHLLDGLDKADSFSWNAHKLMGLPLICSILLVRAKGHLWATNSVGGTDYIFHDEAYGAYDLGETRTAILSGGFSCIPAHRPKQIKSSRMVADGKNLAVTVNLIT
jgi:hypothetical protein